MYEDWTVEQLENRLTELAPAIQEFEMLHDLRYLEAEGFIAIEEYGEEIYMYPRANEWHPEELVV